MCKFIARETRHNRTNTEKMADVTQGRNLEEFQAIITSLANNRLLLLVETHTSINMRATSKEAQDN
jgi:hypothetical protein